MSDSTPMNAADLLRSFRDLSSTQMSELLKQVDQLRISTEAIERGLGPIRESLGYARPILQALNAIAESAATANDSLVSIRRSNEGNSKYLSVIAETLTRMMEVEAPTVLAEFPDHPQCRCATAEVENGQSVDPGEFAEAMSAEYFQRRELTREIILESIVEVQQDYDREKLWISGRSFPDDVSRRALNALTKNGLLK